MGTPTSAYANRWISRLGRPLAAAAAMLATTAALSEVPATPRVSERLSNSPSSKPYLSADLQTRPLDLQEFGYTEDEYFVSGDARVFDLAGGWATEEIARGPYTTRILVRRPKDRSRFSGTVIVEPLNPSFDADAPVMWAESHRQFILDGHAWVGVTIKPNTIAALRAYDADRYSKLSFANPRSDGGCLDINPWSKPGGPETETGLAWDILSQVGVLLKTRSQQNPIPWPVARLYMTGQSQTAGYSRTYAAFFGHETRGPKGRPLYDAYLYSGGPPWHVPLNQCMTDLAPSDPRLITPPVGVPVIEIFTEGDMVTNVASRRPDANSRDDKFRRYEVAGAAHIDAWEDLSFPNAEHRKRGGLRDISAVERACKPTDSPSSDFPNRYVFNAAWRAIDRWVRLGTPAPRAAPLALTNEAAITFDPETAFEKDSNGNAKGGVRTTTVDVPTARWVGAKTGSFLCSFIGYSRPFDKEALQKLYGSPKNYVAKVRARADQLVREGWLTPEDRREILAEAKTVAW